MRLPGIHLLQLNDRLFPKRGLLIEADRSGVYTIHLVPGVVVAGRMHWARLSFHVHGLFKHRPVWGLDERGHFVVIGRARCWPWERSRWEFARGVTALAPDPRWP